MSRTHYSSLQLPSHQDLIIHFLSTNKWPFHVNESLNAEKIKVMIDRGDFAAPNNECFWINSPQGDLVGLIHVFDLDDIEDGFPLFDLRIAERFRGKGYGLSAVKWLVDHLFNAHSGLEKIVGTTRADNLSMRRIFERSLFAKEGHYRKDWPTANGEAHDSVKYAVLREDWESGKITPVNWNDFSQSKKN